MTVDQYAEQCRRYIVLNFHNRNKTRYKKETRAQIRLAISELKRTRMPDFNGESWTYMCAVCGWGSKQLKYLL